AATTYKGVGRCLYRGDGRMARGVQDRSMIAEERMENACNSILSYGKEDIEGNLISLLCDSMHTWDCLRIHDKTILPMHKIILLAKNRYNIERARSKNRAKV